MAEQSSTSGLVSLIERSATGSNEQTRGEDLFLRTFVAKCFVDVIKLFCQPVWLLLFLVINNNNLAIACGKSRASNSGPYDFANSNCR
jgi:hypothetical protein